MTTLGSGELHEKPFQSRDIACHPWICLCYGMEIGDGLQEYVKWQNSIIFTIDSVWEITQPAACRYYTVIKSSVIWLVSPAFLCRPHKHVCSDQMFFLSPRTSHADIYMLPRSLNPRYAPVNYFWNPEMLSSTYKVGGGFSAIACSFPNSRRRHA